MGQNAKIHQTKPKQNVVLWQKQGAITCGQTYTAANRTLFYNEIWNLFDKLNLSPQGPIRSARIDFSVPWKLWKTLKIDPSFGPNTPPTARP